MKEHMTFMEGVVPRFAGWTDEQWAEHDARVAEQREKDVAASTPLSVPREHPLSSFGWPAMYLRDAEVADVTLPACARLLSHDFAEQHIVVLSGAAGTGKSVAAARWAMQARPCPTFVMASRFAASSRYDSEQRDVWFDAGALVLDDLGTEYLDTKGSFLVDLDQLVETFYADLRPLVITTNCTDKQFQSRYGVRVWDRIRHRARWLSIGGDSLRGRR